MSFGLFVFAELVLLFGDLVTGYVLYRWFTDTNFNFVELFVASFLFLFMIVLYTVFLVTVKEDGLI